jgi:hypothetical protein
MIVENANQLYARSCGAAEAMNYLKDPRNYIPLLDGACTVTKARFNHTFCDLSDSVLNDELSRGVQSMGKDLAICMATFGVGKGVMAVVNGVSRPTNKLSRMVNNGGTRVKAYVKDQFNYREHFAAERLRLEAGKTSTKFGKYAEAEDLLGLSQAKTGSGFGQFDARANAIGMKQAAEMEVGGGAMSLKKGPAIIPDRPSSSSFYTTLFKAELKPGAHYPGRDIVHFQEANKQLHSAMQLDTAFACQMETLYPGIAKAIAPGARGAFPINPPTKLGLTWHHNAHETGILELIPQTHHTAKGVVQANLHPGGKGGQQIWGGGRK